MVDAEIKQPIGDSRNIIFKPDGIKLGWSVLAIIASIGLGLYVSNIISPLQKDISILIQDQNGTEKNMKNIEQEFRTHILQCMKESTDIKSSIVDVERSLELHKVHTE